MPVLRVVRVVTFFVALVAAIALGLLGTSITVRRAESISRTVLQPIAQGESDSAKWAINFPGNMVGIA